MTSNILSTNHKKLAINRFQSYWWLALISTIVYFFIGPMYTMLSYQNELKYSLYQQEVNPLLAQNFFQDWFVGGQGYPAFYIAGMIVASVMAIVVFGYLHNKKQVHFYHSLPITRRQLFLHQYGLGLLLNFIPLIMMYFAMVGVPAIYGGLSVVSMGILIKQLLQILLFSWISYSIAVLAAQLTGTVLTQMAMTLILQFGLLVVVACTVLNFDQFLNTFSMGTWMEEDLFALSPFMYAIYYLNQACNFYSVELNIISSLSMVAIAVNIIMAALITIGAFILYTKRPSEAAGSPLVFRFSAPIVKWVLMYTAATLGGTLFLEVGGKVFFVIGILLFALLTHMFSEAILQKDFKAMLHNMKGFAVFAVLLCGFYASLYWDVWQYDNYVPQDIAKVESIEFTMEGVSSYSNEENKRFTNPEQLQQIVHLIDEMVKQKAYGCNSDLYGYNKQMDSEYTTYVDITYHMTNGRHITRQYSSVPYNRTVFYSSL